MEIRELQVQDVPVIVTTRSGPAWNGGIEKWSSRLTEHQHGDRVVLLAVEESKILGYGALVWRPAYRHFREQSIPEIQDLVVAEGQRRRGIGTTIIRALEDRARRAGCASVGLGVGLYADYGAAQRLYVGLGYVPNGFGITYRTKPVVPGSKVRVDDDLVLWLVKPLVG